MSAIKHYAFDDNGEPRSLEEAAEIARVEQQQTEDGRCSNCGRRLRTQRPYALCRRCGDEMNTGGRW